MRSKYLRTAGLSVAVLAMSFPADAEVVHYSLASVSLRYGIRHRMS
jgi:hypothetical protein